MIKKIIIILIIATFAIIYFALQASNAVVIAGDNEFTHSDISNLYNIEQQIAEVTGSNVITNKEDVLYNLVITSLQKNILLKNKIQLDKEKSIAFVEQNNPLKNLYKDIKGSLSENDYYKLIIEPLSTSKMFYEFYKLNNSSQKSAIKLLVLLKEKSVADVIKSFGLKLVTIDIPKTNKILLNEVGGKTGIYTKVIELGDNLIVANIVGYDDKYIKTQSFVFKKVSYKSFLSKFLSKDDIEFPIYSLYNLSDIVNKKGSVLK